MIIVKNIFILGLIKYHFGTCNFFTDRPFLPTVDEISPATEEITASPAGPM